MHPQPLLTEDGKVPARTDCPFRSNCEIAIAGRCLQRGIAQGASVLALVDDEHLTSIIPKLPSAVLAVEFLDNAIAAHVESVGPTVDGNIELSVVPLLEQAEAQGLAANQVQFVLNGMSKPNFQFGARSSDGRWLDQSSVLSLLKGVIGNDQPAQLAAASTIPIYRLPAFHPVPFSCAAARGFALILS